MHDNLLKKGLVYVIIVLFVGVMIGPSIPANVKLVSTANCLTSERSIDTIPISNYDFEVFDKYFEDLWMKFYEAGNIKEKIEVIKNVILRIDSYGLLPDSISVEEAQELVVNAFQFGEKFATYSRNNSFLNNDDIQVYIWAGMKPHPDDPAAESFGSVLNCGFYNYGSEPVEWFESQDYYDISSGERNFHWPLPIWGYYRGSVEPNDYDSTFSGYYSAESELIKANVMVDDIIFSRWGVYLGFGLYYFPQMSGRGNSVSVLYETPRETVTINGDYSSLLFNEGIFSKYFSEEEVFHFNYINFESEELITNEVNNNNSAFKKQKQEVMHEMVSDMPWPMYCHDNRHTGRSSYFSSFEYGFEKWRYKINGMVTSSPSIGEDGTIYLAGSCLYAINPNGTLKWKFDPPGGIFDFTCPAIDENGTIYAGTCSDKYTFMYAINPDGTVKWKKSIGFSYSSPVIGDNGLIYFAHKLSDKSYITALKKDGTIEWENYISGESILSSPAIGMDGTIYCGSHDRCLYAINSDGTLKWKFDTGGRVHGSPTIDSDNTIFIGSENGLHALYQNNGSMKWHLDIGEVWGGLILDEDGIVYVGDSSGQFYAINQDGAKKWTYNAPGSIWFTSPALSANGIIYFGTLSLGGGQAELIALNTDGTEKWTWADNYYDYDNFQSAPAIGANGTVYIASSHWLSGGYFYLHAFGMFDSNAPATPTITGQTNGEPWKEYEYMFKAIDPNNDDLYYYIDWGDGSEEEWIGPYKSGEEVKVYHTWTGPILYTIIAKAKDTSELFSPWGMFDISLPRSKISNNRAWLRFLDLCPILQRILGLLR